MSRLHRAWIVAAITFLAVIGAAGFRAVPGVMINPLKAEFGWSSGTISAAVSINLLLYGLTSPFAAALMERFGVRRVVSVALFVVAIGSGTTIWMTASWQLMLCWGLLVGIGTGSMALAFVATVTGRWFVRRRGLVTGVLTAGGATGQLVFLPLLAGLVQAYGWRTASLTVAGSALAVVPLVLLFLRERPSDIGVEPYGASTDASSPATDSAPPGPPLTAIGALRSAVRSKAFWLLAGGFAICGASTNGLIGVHFIPAAHDHGMSEPMAAGLLALVGIFDIAGTVLSGWLTDRMSSRLLLGIYYTGRGLSLMLLPLLLTESAHPGLLVFILFYGLDWVATVPPTIALCRRHFGAAGAIVFGWVFASHQFGAAIASSAAGVLRDTLGGYTVAFMAAGALCLLAALMSIRISPDRVMPAAPKQNVGAHS